MSRFVVDISKRCVACGTCIKVCPRGAIVIEDGIKAIVNRELCVGCGLCAKACPAGIITKIKRGEQDEKK